MSETKIKLLLKLIEEYGELCVKSEEYKDSTKASVEEFINVLNKKYDLFREISIELKEELI